MARYRLIQPHGMYVPGTILDTELPPQRPFSIEGPTARRLTELGVLEPVDDQDPVLPKEEPGWTQTASRPARLDASGAGRQAPGVSTGASRARTPHAARRTPTKE